MNPAHGRMLRYFRFEHLPQELQNISIPLCDIAREITRLCENSVDPAEVTVGLRKLLEAKDCFVRAMVK